MNHVARDQSPAVARGDGGAGATNVGKGRETNRRRQGLAIKRAQRFARLTSALSGACRHLFVARPLRGLGTRPILYESVPRPPRH